MIRTIQQKDAAEVWGIIVESLGYVCEREVVSRRIEALADDPRCLSLVWEDDETGAVGGFIHALRYDTLHNEGGWDVITLAVTPGLQGRGVGGQLLCELERRARQLGGTFVRLNSSVWRTEAHGFYEHLGYEGDKVQRHFIKQLV